jgi:hypothetical protein
VKYNKPSDPPVSLLLAIRVMFQVQALPHPRIKHGLVYGAGRLYTQDRRDRWLGWNRGGVQRVPRDGAEDAVRLGNVFDTFDRGFVI